MKKNYAAWAISYGDFFSEPTREDQLRFLIRFGVLAPSTHNSQPWKFSVKDDAIIISPDLARSLAVSDPVARHLYISLGCAAENIMIAAEYYGAHPRITCAARAGEEMPDITISFSGETFSRAAEPPEKHLISAIPGRRSNRNAYISRPIPDDIINEIKSISSGTIHVDVIADDALKVKIADILMASRVQAFSHRPFRKEMAGYKRNDFTNSFTGMPGFTMGLNPIVSLVAGFMIRNFNIMKILRKSETDLLKKYTALFIFISVDNHDIKGWIDSGRGLERALLLAQHYGIQASLSAVPLDVKPLQELIGTSARPEMFVRMGYTNDVPGHSPRFPAENVAH